MISKLKSNIKLIIGSVTFGFVLWAGHALINGIRWVDTTTGTNNSLPALERKIDSGFVKVDKGFIDMHNEVKDLRFSFILKNKMDSIRQIERERHANEMENIFHTKVIETVKSYKN